MLKQLRPAMRLSPAVELSQQVMVLPLPQTLLESVAGFSVAGFSVGEAIAATAKMEKTRVLMKAILLIGCFVWKTVVVGV